MKLLLVFAFLALACVARSAPAASSTTRVLILPDYHDADDDMEEIKSHDDEIEINPHEVEDDDEETTTTPTTTTTTTTTRRSIFGFPTRNRKLFPSRQPTERITTTLRAITTPAFDIEEEQEETENQYEGDFRHVRNFGKYFKKLFEDFKRMFRKLTGYDIFNSKKREEDHHDDE